MKRLLLAGCMAVMAALPAHAQPVTQQQLSYDVGHIATEFDQELKAHGIRGVSEQVDNCYDSAVGADTVGNWNIPLLRQCVLYDSAAYQFNKTMRRIFKMKGVDVDSDIIRYFTDEPFELRTQFYVPLAFGDVSPDTLQGVQMAGTLITRIMEGQGKK